MPDQWLSHSFGRLWRGLRLASDRKGAGPFCWMLNLLLTLIQKGREFFQDPRDYSLIGLLVHRGFALGLDICSFFYIGEIIATFASASDNPCAFSRTIYSALSIYRYSMGADSPERLPALFLQESVFYFPIQKI